MGDVVTFGWLGKHPDDDPIKTREFRHRKYFIISTQYLSNQDHKTLRASIWSLSATE